ncbi:biotin transporter BioY [Alloscardovia theropitheci]|uniref:Biotin transporter BioY n=2 Tax=Alloscardovia theropitheci TaxID=2496842 RepID=A0A4R0QN82_9BIFI|nr:biotin transporter BioY [Alloscardovia theropitheci]
MQTFVLMLIALNLTLSEGLSVISTYIALGAAGMPIFSGGMSTLALVGPSAGFIWGFIPAFVVSHYGLEIVNSRLQSSDPSSLLAHTSQYRTSISRAAGAFIALTLGCMVVLYIIGVSIQSILVNASFSSLMVASMGFVGFDCIKALVAVLATFGVKQLVLHVQHRK